MTFQHPFAHTEKKKKIFYPHFLKYFYLNMGTKESRIWMWRGLFHSKNVSAHNMANEKSHVHFPIQIFAQRKRRIIYHLKMLLYKAHIRKEPNFQESVSSEGESFEIYAFQKFKYITGSNELLSQGNCKLSQLNSLILLLLSFWNTYPKQGDILLLTTLGAFVIHSLLMRKSEDRTIRWLCWGYGEK